MTSDPATIDPDAAWAAFLARDRAHDGRFVAGVRSTGIYCRAGCPARRPARAGVCFFPDGEAARAAGYRACRRCRPDEAARDGAAVARAAALVAEAVATGEAVALGPLASAVGYTPSHFHRLFRRATGLTPAAYARALRASAAADALAGGESVTAALHAAGYGAAGRFYATGAPRLGMAPAAARAGGAGQAIRWTVAATSLGPLLVAATGKGLCRVAFDEDEAALRARFPAATILPADDALAGLAARAVAAVEEPGRAHDLPLDVAGTAFQEAVWRALAAVPPGTTVGYAALAAAAGNPGASRAAGSACGANPVAVLVPCHRARRGDGSPGGYAWGLERKAALLERERARAVAE